MKHCSRNRFLPPPPPQPLPKKKLKQYYVELQLYKLILIPSAVIKNIERSLGTHNDLHFVHSSQHLCDTVTRIAPEIRVKKS